MRSTTIDSLADGPVAAFVPKLGADRRKHRRVAITLLGRFMRENKDEYPCRLSDISVGGATVLTSVIPDIGELVIAYFDKIGGIQGYVVRLFDGGFAMRLKVSRHKQEKLAADLTWLINRDEFDGIDARRDERFSIGDRFSTLILEDGSETKCELFDVSLTGASVVTDVRPALGSEVALGKQRAFVRRHHERGLGLEFSDVAAAAARGQFAK